MKLKKLLAAAAWCTASVLALSSCEKKQDGVTPTPPVTPEVMSRIKQLGFSSQGALAVEGGYVVEGDIFLTPENLAQLGPAQRLRVGTAEQYQTTNLVNVGTGRTVTVAVATALPAAYVTAADAAIARYNAQGLRLRMSRVTSGADITLVQAPKRAQYLASGGFPTGGNPYNQVLINSGAIGTANSGTYIATILAHELGHCVGFRHTDYMDRSYSCGGAYSNEGASTVGAILIPGTPAGPDALSWMLACIASGDNRPFNPNDVTALAYLYK